MNRAYRPGVEAPTARHPSAQASGLGYANVLMTLLTVAVLGTLCATAGNPLDHWMVRTNETRAFGVHRAVAFGAGRFAAVGDTGVVLTSDDGTAWAEAERLGSASLYGLTYGGDRFVAVGDFAGIEISPDAQTWHRTHTGSGTLAEVAYGAGFYVAVGTKTVAFDTKPFILHSTEATNWNEVSPESFGGLASVAYGNGRFVAGGLGNSVFVSVDGTSWAQQSTGDLVNFLSVAFGYGTFVAVTSDGDIVISPDGNGLAGPIQRGTTLGCGGTPNQRHLR